MPLTNRLYDVVVIGGGNAGLCAALTAREAGATVAVIECAPRHFRGGNSRHTRNLRSAHASPTETLTDSYHEEEFLADLQHVTGSTDEVLARLVIRGSTECLAWMRRQGARFQSSLRGTLHLGRTNAFFLGGGKALMNSYYAAAERLGIDVVYDAEVTGLDLAGDGFRAARVEIGGESHDVQGRAVVLAAGGFESNIEWLREAWGDAADNFIIRGTPYNKGRVLKLMLDAGAESVGDPRACHAIAVDARAPKFDGGIVTRLDCVSLGIVVNKHAVRFYDEGEDFWPKRYAIWGGLIASQPDQIAYSIIDAKAVGRFMPSVFPPIAAGSIRELAAALRAAGRNAAGHHRHVQPCRASWFVRPRSAGQLPHGRARSGEDALGSADRHPAILGLPPQAGHHLHVSRVEGEREGARHHGRRRPQRQHLRGRGNHGRQHPAQGIHRRCGYDHRHGDRPDRRCGGGPSCKLSCCSAANT